MRRLIFHLVIFSLILSFSHNKEPGNGDDLTTLLEFFRRENIYTGIITTTYTTHASPAAFSAHERSRNNYYDIALVIFNNTVNFQAVTSFYKE